MQPGVTRYRKHIQVAQNGPVNNVEARRTDAVLTLDLHDPTTETIPS
jgi:hypothetical protein